MSTDKLMLLLAELDAEVMQEALELYLLARPVSSDRRFEYRYRAAHSLLENLRQGVRESGTFPRGDDDDAQGRDDPAPKRHSIRERLED